MEEQKGNDDSTISTSEASFQSVVEKIPGSWLQAFILSLSPKDRHTLARTSKCLAGAVIRHTPCVKLTLRAGPERSSCCNTERCVVLQLLADCRSFHVTLDQGYESLYREHLRFPRDLARHITHLCLKGTGKFTTPIEWASLELLQELNCRNINFEENRMLWQDLKVEHVPKLKAFTCMYSYPGSDKARMIGARIQQLTTNMPEMLQHACYFSQLQTLRIDGYCQVPADIAKMLIKHPKLCEVTLANEGAAFCGTHTSCSCSWRTLVLHGLAAKILLRLPLGSLSEIRFVGGILLPRVIVKGRVCKDTEAIRHVVQHHSHCLVCHPRNGQFTVQGMNEDAVQLVRCLRGACELIVEYAAGRILQPLLGIMPACVHTLKIYSVECGEWRQAFRAVPASVRSLCLSRLPGIDWSHFWHDLPTSITGIHIGYGTTITSDEVQELLRTAPLYITRLALYAEPKLFEVLHAIAPSHMTLLKQYY